MMNPDMSRPTMPTEPRRIERPDPIRSPIDDPIRMSPFMPSYRHGTDYVKETGPAILHEGEKVIPKEENKHMNSVKEILGGHEPHKSVKKIRAMVHMKSHNGKHVIIHQHHAPHHNSENDEMHVLDNMSDVHDHIENHAGMPNEGENEVSQSTPGPVPQMTASASPIPGM